MLRSSSTRAPGNATRTMVTNVHPDCPEVVHMNYEQCEGGQTVNVKGSIIHWPSMFHTCDVTFLPDVSVIYNLVLPPTHFISARPLLKHTFPPATLVTNLTSSHPSFVSPVRHISVTNLSPGRTGLANR